MVPFSHDILDPVMFENTCLYMSVSFLERLNLNLHPHHPPDPGELREITRNNVPMHSLPREEDSLTGDKRCDSRFDT